MINWIIFALVHIVVPLSGIVVYLLLVRKMKKQAIPHSPVYHLFWVFGTYGVLLIILLTEIFWKWSGMASIGTGGLAIFGPFILGYIMFKNHKYRTLTLYHKLTYRLSTAFLLLIGIAIISSIVYNLFH